MRHDDVDGYWLPGTLGICPNCGHETVHGRCTQECEEEHDDDEM